MPVFSGNRLSVVLITALVGVGLLFVASTAQAQIPPRTINQPCVTCEPTDVHMADLDDDGRADVLSTSQVDDKVAWHRSTGSGFGPQQVISTASGNPETVATGDFDGDGDLDVVVGATGDVAAPAEELVWYENQIGEPGGDSDGFGPARVISSSNGRVVSAATGNLDGDGKDDIVIGTGNGIFWFASQVGESGDDFSGASAITSSATVTPIEVQVAELNDDSSLPDVLYMQNGNSQGEVAWHENTGGSFGSKKLITDNVFQPNDVAAADVDDDSALEVLSASSEGKVAWYDDDPTAASGFGAQTVINQADDPRSLATGDVDDDGDADVFAATFVFDGDNRISWYESQVGEAGGDGDGFGAEQVISTLPLGNPKVAAANADTDAAPEVFSMSDLDDRLAWYDRSGGAYGSPQPVNTWPDAIQPRSVEPAALDGDADADVLVASQVDSKVSWYENTGSDGSFSGQNVISASAGEPQEAVAADLNGDDKPDAIVASRDRGSTPARIAWYENQTGEGGADSDGFGDVNVVDEPGEDVDAVIAANLDDDSDKDLLVIYGGVGKNIAWYENKIGQGGDADGFGPEQVIQGNLTNLLSIAVADLNGGGNDVIAGYGFDPGKVVWFEHTGGGSFGSETVITKNADEQVPALATGDLDDDGDTDVVSASYSGSNQTIAWYENQIGQGGDADGFGGLTPISSTVELTEDLHTADLNDDGTVDVLSASKGDDKVAWYPNNGGSFSSQKVIYSADRTPIQGAFSVSTADVNQDGDVDVLSAASGREEIAWHKNSPGVLPVEMAGLRAQIDDGKTRLSWTTASETNNAGFYVQRLRPDSDAPATESDDVPSGSWQRVGWVEGHGTTSEAQRYRFTDVDPPYEAERITYRLLQVDTDGSRHPSKTATVERNTGRVQLRPTTPNPAREQVTVRYAVPEQQTVTLRLYDVLGREVRTVVSEERAGRQTRQLDVGGLPSGVYILRLRAGSQTRTRELTIVQ